MQQVYLKWDLFHKLHTSTQFDLMATGVVALDDNGWYILPEVLATGDVAPTHTQNTKNIGVKTNKDEGITEIITYLNQKAGTKYKSNTSATKSLVTARLKEGFSVDDFKRVIDHKCNEWLNNRDMRKYLRPATLFAASKFEGYLNEAPEQKTEEQKRPQLPPRPDETEVKDYGFDNDWS